MSFFSLKRMDYAVDLSVSVRLSVPLMGTTFRYIFAILKPVLQTVIIDVQFFSCGKNCCRKWCLNVGANDIALM